MIVPWLVLKYAPPHQYLPQQRDKTILSLQIALSLGAIRIFNSWLSRRSLNNGLSDKFDWPREIVVVTGGSDGVGKFIVLHLAARAKCQIAILDIQEPRYTLPNGAHFYKCDITKVDEIAAAAAQIRSDLGGDPTVLVNNAGILLTNPLLDSPEKDTRLMFEVNTLSHYWLAQEFLSAMVRRNHGMVVTVASLAANLTSAHLTSYSATKAAALAFHEGLTSELKTRYDAPRVRTVLVTPAFIKTFLARDLSPADTFTSRLLAPESVAEAIVDQILTGESGYVGIPRTPNILAWQLRSLPAWIQNPFRDRLERFMRRPKQKNPWLD